MNKMFGLPIAALLALAITTIFNTARDGILAYDSPLGQPATNPYNECPPNSSSIWVRMNTYGSGEIINVPLDIGYASSSGNVNYITGVLWQEIAPVAEVPRWSDHSAKALAVAARTLAYHACGVEGWGGYFAGYWGMDDSQKQSYNPYRTDLDVGGISEKERYRRLVEEVAGIHMTYLSDDFDVQYRNKTGAESSAFPPSPPHLAVDDPVGANYEPLRNPGLAQINANHWASGQDPTADNAKHPAWPDYRSILVHYYTYVSLVDSAGNGLAPGIRWNALKIDWYTSSSQPPILIPGGSYPVKVAVQNTGIIDLPQGQWALSYKWAKAGHSDLSSSKRVWASSTILKGDPPTHSPLRLMTFPIGEQVPTNRSSTSTARQPAS
ncbi:MAG: SpoIID/LytB domain-containing protein [Caldilineaceae bacterium]|nr:SpoIID/LytB domain-containing protein [Caldilineaceae bacterium]